MLLKNKELWIKLVIWKSLHKLPFYWKSWDLWENVEKYGGARQATDDDTIRRMFFSCRIIKARTQTHACYNNCSSTAKNVYANAPQCYVISTTIVLLRNNTFVQKINKRMPLAQKKLGKPPRHRKYQNVLW